jgi:hypothetical protein
VTYNELDSISLPDEPFGASTGVIVHKWEGETLGREGSLFLVEFPKDDDSFAIVEMFVASEAGSSPELLSISDFG